MASKSKPSRARVELARARAKRDDARNVAGPSTNPATNLIMVDIVMRAGSYLLRDGLERRLLGRRYEKDIAREIVANRTLGQSLMRVAAAKVATRSVPGALVVGGGLLAKILLDRAGDKRRERRQGDAKLLEQTSELDEQA